MTKNILEKIIDNRIVEIEQRKSWVPIETLKNYIIDYEDMYERKFYDFKAKYNLKAKTEHIIPVKISKKNMIKVLSLAYKAHRLLKCRGVTRSDFKFFKNKFFLLELNTQPGMTQLSLVPEIAAYKGISFFQLIEWILRDASIKR